MNTVQQLTAAGPGQPIAIALAEAGAAAWKGVPPGIVVALSEGAELTYQVEAAVGPALTRNGLPINVPWVPIAVPGGVGPLPFLVSHVRLNVTAWTSGTATFGVIQ